MHGRCVDVENLLNEITTNREINDNTISKERQPLSINKKKKIHEKEKNQNTIGQSRERENLERETLKFIFEKMTE